MGAGFRQRIAIGQFRMRWTCEENTAAIVSAMRIAAGSRADICVFPELALTGFHRQIASQATPAQVGESLGTLQKECERLGMAIAVGAPTFNDAGAFNSHVAIDETGRVLGAVEKNGLTPAEATFFAAGTQRPAFRLRGLTCTSVLCREVEDEELLAVQLPPGRADVIFWPGIIRPPVGTTDRLAAQAIKQAQRLAQRTGAFVIQANWPNSLNYPEESVHAGQSVVIGPTGDVALRLPTAEPGSAIFQLGSTDHEWHAEAA